MAGGSSSGTGAGTTSGASGGAGSSAGAAGATVFAMAGAEAAAAGGGGSGSASSSSDGASQGTQPGGDGLRVELIRTPGRDLTGLVSVTVPAQRDAFLIPVPQELYANLSPEIRQKAELTGERGGKLPKWLSFNAEKMTVSGNAVPANGLPRRLALRINGVRVVILVTQEATKKD
ncbi:hypothetical protein RA210_U70002 [Rubrivivax sp. A210]|nr:hypothetical protein RA210_U70002 [Rubrivivax sp. A210]